jgi:hypothetical protein
VVWMEWGERERRPPQARPKEARLTRPRVKRVQVQGRVAILPRVRIALLLGGVAWPGWSGWVDESKRSRTGGASGLWTFHLGWCFKNDT